MSNPLPPPIPPQNDSFFSRHSVLFKLLGVVFLGLLLLIPLNMIDGVLDERLLRRDEAVKEITSSWGEEQNVIGPVLRIPYQYRFNTWKEETVNNKIERRLVEETAVAYAFFLPDTLKIVGDAKTETRKRGIYQAAVYRTTLNLSGVFPQPDFALLKVADKDVLWNEATISVSVNDLRGTQQALDLSWGTRKLAFLPGSLIQGFPSGITARIGATTLWKESIPFSLNLDLNGSGEISFAPLGVQNEVSLKSNWPDPGFRGAFLPFERTITAQGFQAAWKVSYYGRNYPQAWGREQNSSGFNIENVSASLFGAEFISTLDTYRFVERSIKYGSLFVALMFTVFFLFEITAQTRVHPFQYLMVGAVLCLFYLALLSISEFFGFSMAYLIAAFIATSMVAWYCRSFLGGGQRTILVTGGLVSVYGFLYITIQQQDYALLFGTIGLFIVAFIVMYVTRKIDWYKR